MMHKMMNMMMLAVANMNADLLGGEHLIATIVLIISQPQCIHHYEYDEYRVEYDD